jgi:hypothetical protein
VEATTEEILRNIRRMGFMVTVNRMGEYIEMHAIKLLSCDDPVKIARMAMHPRDSAQN